MLPYLEVSSTHDTVQLGKGNKNQQPKFCQEGARAKSKNTKTSEVNPSFSFRNLLQNQYKTSLEPG